MKRLPVSPLSLDCLTRDYYGTISASAIAQLAPLAENDCYQPKIYRAPALENELLAANAYTSYGMKVTPGAIICCFYLPADPTTNLPGAFNVQITDQSLRMKWFDEPVPSYFLANNKPTYLAAATSQGHVMGAAPVYFVSPYPVVGSGLFLVEIWETSGVQQRIELAFGVLEPMGEACL
jgi:hypothetical protein